MLFPRTRDIVTVAFFFFFLTIWRSGIPFHSEGQDKTINIMKVSLKRVDIITVVRVFLWW